MAEAGRMAGFEAPKTEAARQEIDALRARAAQLEAQLSSQGVPQEHAPQAQHNKRLLNIGPNCTARKDR